MPKEVPETTNIDHFGGIWSDFWDFGAFWKEVILLIVFDWTTNGTQNQTNQKKSLRRRPGPYGTSRTEAKEGGGAEVNLPLGSEG